MRWGEEKLSGGEQDEKFKKVKLLFELANSADMENARNFTRAGFFISRFYPKVRELRQYQNRDKTL